MAIYHSHVHVSSDIPSPLLCDHTGRSDTMARGTHWHGRLLSPFLSLLLCLSPLLFPVSLSRTNPIPMLSSPSSSPTQPELCMHSPLIHYQSYLRSGTIATERAQLRTAACRKIALLPQGCWTLCIQQHQPSSLSLLRIKSSTLRVEKIVQLLCV